MGIIGPFGQRDYWPTWAFQSEGFGLPVRGNVGVIGPSGQRTIGLLELAGQREC